VRALYAVCAMTRCMLLTRARIFAHRYTRSLSLSSPAVHFAAALLRALMPRCGEAFSALMKRAPVCEMREALRLTLSYDVTQRGVIAPLNLPL